MEKETYISDLKKRITNKTGKNKLEAISKWIEDQFGLQNCFCKIFGKRWSYFAGSLDQTEVQTKINLNDEWGWIFNDDPRKIDNWDEIFRFMKEELPEK